MKNIKIALLILILGLNSMGLARMINGHNYFDVQGNYIEFGNKYLKARDGIYFTIINSFDTYEEAQTFINDVFKDHSDEVELAIFPPLHGKKTSVLIAAKTTEENAQTACGIAKNLRIASQPFIWFDYKTEP